MFRGISLANKCLLLFGGAVVLIVLAALVFPFLRMNALVDEGQLEVSRQLTAAWLRAEAAEGRARTERAVRGMGMAWEPSLERAGLRLENTATGPRTEEYVGVRATRYTIAQAREAAETDEFLGRAVRALERDPDAEDWHVARWSATTREYRYVLALRGAAAQADEERPLTGLVMLERRSVQATKLLLVNAAYLLSAGSVVLALALLVFYLITHKIILSPVRELRDTAEKVRQGDLTRRSDIQTGDEFEELAQTFNSMLTDMEDRQVQLRAINAAMDLKMNELAEANVALYEAAKLKGDFLASVSHELRTPLNSIIGFAELLLDIAQTELAAGDDSTRLAKRIRYLENIVTAARNLLEMINGLLEMAKIEAGKIELNVDRVNVTELCEGVLGLIYPQANKKGLVLKLEVEEGVPLIETDGKKVRQVVFNFLSNAVKFTSPGPADQPEKGQVTLRAEKLVWSVPGGTEAGAAADSDQMRVRISVIDTGPGIAPEDQARIFEKFQQLDGGHTREHAGTGLGLAICKELAGLLQGEIQVVSDVGRGSMFSLILPVRMSAAASRETKLEAKFRGTLGTAREWR